MGWGCCGTDDLGREIGYSIPASCDHPGCDTTIHRGLAYCCGGMHGGQGHHDEKLDVWLGCGGYFCYDHLSASGNLCPSCMADYEKLCAEVLGEGPEGEPID